MKAIVLVDEKPKSCKQCIFNTGHFADNCILTQYDAYPGEHCPLIKVTDSKFIKLERE